jgi:hypothetical protein
MRHSVTVQFTLLHLVSNPNLPKSILEDTFNFPVKISRVLYGETSLWGNQPYTVFLSRTVLSLGAIHDHITNRCHLTIGRASEPLVVTIRLPPSPSFPDRV